jgi:hypothetical protein
VGIRGLTVGIACALVLALARPAAAQGKLGAGLSFLNAEGGTGAGLVVDYSKVVATVGGGRLGWLGDVSTHVDEGIRITTLMGGARYSRMSGEKLTWFLQGLIGMGRFTATGDVGDECDAIEADCSATDLAIAPGVGVDVWMTDRLSLRLQFDLPMILTEVETFNGRRFWFGISLPFGPTP